MPIENNPERIAILSANLKKLIANKSINKIRVDVKITDNLETIPWWNIIARIWNRSHLDSSKVAESLLEAVKNPSTLQDLNPDQLDKLFNQLSGILTKFTNIHSKTRKIESIQSITCARDIVSREYNSRPKPKI